MVAVPDGYEDLLTRPLFGHLATTRPDGTVQVNPMYPTAAPPPVRVESYGAPRAGFVWIAGRWNWLNGRWEWVAGHWERERANMSWVPGRWELQGNYYVWIEGRWDQAAPPPPTVRDHRH